MEPYTFESYFIEDLKQAHMYDSFFKYPPLYQVIRASHICGYHKKEIDHYHKLMDKLFQECQTNKMIGDWDDYGRLTNY